MYLYHLQIAKKWACRENAAITGYRPSHGTARKRHRTQTTPSQQVQLKLSNQLSLPKQDEWNLEMILSTAPQKNKDKIPLTREATSNNLSSLGLISVSLSNIMYCVYNLFVSWCTYIWIKYCLHLTINQQNQNHHLRTDSNWSHRGRAGRGLRFPFLDGDVPRSTSYEVYIN